ncbi:MAG TPA: cobalamin-independent methionine synthase II family protein [Candidatus Binataceae bacterium]|nr:cobalamin-independent methionine synthase II family protein [Candidatus Binataceae bacterium]
MLNATKDLKLATAMVGSFPRPSWFTESLRGRPFKVAMGDSLYREQYLDTVACYINEQERAGLDILTDGDARFDLEVGGRSWFFYVIERLGGVSGFRDSSHFLEYADIRPGHILYEVQEAYHPPAVTGKITRGPLHYAAIWKSAQKMTRKPVKFGGISATCLPMMLWNEFYRDDHEMVMDLAAALNEELRELAAAGCPLIQIEEPPHHFACCTTPPASDKELEFFTRAFNREVEGVNTEVWAHTCWGNPNQQSFYWERPSYERSLPHLLALDADVLTLECASNQGRDLPLLKHHRTSKKIAIGVINHTVTTVEPPQMIADLIRKALEYVPPERLIVTADCGFGREGLSRRIAFYKCVALVQGTNIVRRELGLPEAEIRAADPRFAFRQA